MIRRLLGAALVTLVAAIHPASAKEITLRVDATPSIFSEMFKDLAAGFEAANPDIHLVIDTSQRDQTDMIQRTMRQGLVGDLPDLSFQGFNYLKLLADRGFILPLDARIAADADWTPARYSPSVVAAGTVDGKVYGVGVAFSFPIIFYNAALVAEVQGGNATLPADWDGIFAVARQIQDRHSEVLGACTRYNSFVTQGHIMSRGGSLGNADGTAVAFTDAKGMAAFDLYQRFGTAGQARTDMTDGQIRQAFASGRVGILVDSSSSLESFVQQSGGAFPIGTTHLPFADGAKLPTAGIAAVLHARDPERRDAAWRFMRYVAGPEGQVIVGRKTGYVPANEVASASPNLLGDYYKARPAMNAALESVRYAAPWYVFQGPHAARIDKLFADRLQQVVTLREPPEAAARSLADEITALIVP